MRLAVLQFARGRIQMWILDYPTLLLVLLAAIAVGMGGLLQVDVIGRLLGQYERLADLIIGLAGIWQLCRQRWF